MKKAILFDLDGTLTDSGEGIINCAQYAFQQMGYPVPPREEMGVFVGPPLWDTFEKFGIPKEQAILSATSVPAKELGQEAEIGEISSGKLADFVVCDEELNRKHVYLSGTQLDS